MALPGQSQKKITIIHRAVRYRLYRGGLKLVISIRNGFHWIPLDSIGFQMKRSNWKCAFRRGSLKRLLGDPFSTTDRCSRHCNFANVLPPPQRAPQQAGQLNDAFKRLALRRREKRASRRISAISGTIGPGWRSSICPVNSNRWTVHCSVHTVVHTAERLIRWLKRSSKRVFTVQTLIGSTGAHFRRTVLS